MIQQINLYQDELKLGSTTPALNNITYGLIAAIVLILVFSLYLLMDLNQTKTSLQKSKQQLLKVEKQIKLLKIQHPIQQLNPILAQEISQSQNILDSLSKVIHSLSDKDSDQNQGFSRYYSALASQSMAEVWLTNIAINAEQQSITLLGSSYQAEKIPALLQKFRQETIFQGKTFAQLIMEQSKEDENQIDFTVTSEIAEENHD